MFPFGRDCHNKDQRLDCYTHISSSHGKQNTCILLIINTFETLGTYFVIILLGRCTFSICLIVIGREFHIHNEEGKKDCLHISSLQRGSIQSVLLRRLYDILFPTVCGTKSVK